MAEDLIALAESLVERALPGEQVEVIVSRATSTTVRVYAGEVESLTSADSSGVSLPSAAGNEVLPVLVTAMS